METAPEEKPSPSTDPHASDTEEPEEWEVQRNNHKLIADKAFRDSDYQNAVTNYSLALSFDPDYHILYSNRSAAYLFKGEKSRALADAKKCVELKPDFVKGHSRVASSMLSLGRWNEARKVYDHILKKMDPNNAVAKKGLDDCKKREDHAKKQEREFLRFAEEEAKRKEEEKNQCKNLSNDADDKAEIIEEEEDEDDLLNGFFDEVEQATTKKVPKPSESASESVDTGCSSKNENKLKIQVSDLKNTETQISRLLCTNHEWYNLNPFQVLDISHNAPTEVISRRYKALSLLLHPDKVRNNSGKDNEKISEDAAQAFEYARKAMETLQDEDKARHIRELVEQGYKQGKKDYENTLQARDKTQRLGLSSFQEKATLKIFAEIEQKRRDVERRKRNHEMRERAQEDAEMKKYKNERKFDVKWKEEGRVEKRIGNWRDFQKVDDYGKRRRVDEEG